MTPCLLRASAELGCAAGLMVVLMSLPAPARADTLRPPVARRIPKPDTTLGDVRVDDYAWLREKKNPEVIAYLEAENAYTKAAMATTDKLQETLYQEMLGRIQETDQTVPYPEGGYFYYSRTVKGLQYPIHCRKKGNLEAPEEVILDENAEAGKDAHYAVGAISVSPDARLMAFTEDRTGAERYLLRVKDLTTGIFLADHATDITSEVEWAADNRTLFYTLADSADRPYRLYRHELGGAANKDALVFEEPDPLFNLELHKTRSGAYLMIKLDSFGSSEWRYISAAAPKSPFQVMRARRPGLEYDVDHSGDWFYIRTNEGAVDFKIVRAPVGSPGQWEPFLDPKPGELVDAVLAFKNHLAVFERAHALRQVVIMDLVHVAVSNVEFPEPVYTVSPSSNHEFDTTKLRFDYASMVTPRTTYDYDMNTGVRELKKVQPVLGGYDASKYTTERTWATATDGAKVPISLVYRKGLVKDGKRPMLLYAYGSYGLSTDPTFNSNVVSLVDRGMIFAIAHIRGGQEMGRAWYDQGKLLNKKNTFTDFIACAEHLVKEKYTSTDRLAIRGGSAGGLLMGAVTNMRPDLFKAVVADVPFVDVINTMMDASIPLTTQEWVQWGDPHKPEFYSYMKSYSPYDNVERKAYPNMLITGGLNDPRVGYWEPTKWNAKLRALRTDSNLQLLRINMGAGHGGASGRYDALREQAVRYAFVLHVLGLDRVEAQ